MDLATLPAVPTAADVDRCVGALLDGEAQGSGVEVLTWHTFADGMVARTVLLEAGTRVASVLHRIEHLCIVAGDCTIIGEGLNRRVCGHQVLTSLPSDEGKRRIVVAHADTWWTTVHPNHDNCRDVAELARRYAADPEHLQQLRWDLPASPPMEAIQCHGPGSQ